MVIRLSVQTVTEILKAVAWKKLPGQSIHTY